MTSVAIIISHYESMAFLRTAIRQIRKYEHTEIYQTIIICDQSSEETYRELQKEYVNSFDIQLVHTKPLYSGFGLDYIFRNMDFNTDYVVQLHSDSFPVHPNWIYLSVKLIEEYNLSFVGQLQFICNGTEKIYPPQKFFAMAQCFNVARTETYRELSLKAGFTRFHNRPQSGLSFENDDWDLWAADDYERKGSDDDVVAFHWNGKYKTDDMLGLAITGYIQPSFGRLIEDVVFHFGSCRESLGVLDTMPELYQYYTKKINEDYSDELISEMLNLAKLNKCPEAEILNRNYWDGNLKRSSFPSDEINKRIEELKQC